jgi:cell division protein FtsB
MVVDSSPQKVCNHGGFPEPPSIECFAMPTIPQRIASAFAVLFGQYGDVTKMARDREQSRQSLYREAAQAIDAVDGTAVQARVAELEQQVAQLRSQVHDLQQRLGRAVEMTPEKQAELACVAQAEGVSLPVARRLLQVLLPPKAPSVPTLGRATAEAGRRAGQLLEVLEEAACPRVAQASADEIFSDASPS